MHTQQSVAANPQNKSNVVAMLRSEEASTPPDDWMPEFTRFCKSNGIDNVDETIRTLKAHAKIRAGEIRQAGKLLQFRA